MNENKIKAFSEELMKYEEELKELFSAGSKIKAFKFGMFIQRKIDFEISDEEIDAAFENVKNEYIKNKKKEESSKLDGDAKKEKNKTEKQDALYLLDLFEKYVE